MSQAITLRQLRYLVFLADELHFGRAAQAANVSQPSLSAQVQQLEAALGAQLVERAARGAFLTPAGAEVAARARAILGSVRDLADAARAASRPLSSRLRLGVIPTAGPYFLPRVLPGLRSAHPDLRLLLREEQTARLVERLKGGELDLALLALPVEDDSLEETPLYDEPFVAAVPEGHPLASRPFVTEGDLIRERLLLLEDGHCLREQALALCGRASRRDEEGFAATSLATLREMVAGRIGVTLMPLLSVTGPSAPSGGISLVPFAPPRAGRRIGLVWRRHAAREADFRALASFLRAHLPEGVVPVGEEALS